MADHTPIHLLLPFSLSSLSDLFAPPFGPLNWVHEYAITNAVGFTPRGVVLFLAPFVFMYAQCYMLLLPGTRYTRVALGIATLSSMWSAWTSVRFTNPWYNAWNHVITMPYIQFAFKALEFSCLKGPIRDPHMPQRPQAVAAWALMINSRMVGLGNVGLDTAPGISNAKIQKGTIERHLRKNMGWRPKTRGASMARHLAYAGICYAILDMIYQFIPRLHPVLGNPYGGADTLFKFTADPLYLLPGVFDIRLPPWVLHTVIEAGIGITIWMFFEAIYQLFAFVHIGLGWNIQDWDPNMFGSMWQSDSLIDLWGTRWHQTFRHMFIVCANITLKALYLPITSQTVFFVTFFYSGFIHYASELAMNPVGDPFTLLTFFLFPGVGCVLESTFKKVTGRRVQGVWGQIWTWAFMTVTGRGVAAAWLASGYAGCKVTPPGGPGDFLAAMLVKYIAAPAPGT